MASQASAIHTHHVTSQIDKIVVALSDSKEVRSACSALLDRALQRPSCAMQKGRASSAPASSRGAG